MEHRFRQLCVALAVVATLAGVMIVVLVGASVTMRHVAQAPFRFTEELVGLLMTAAFFLALPLVTLNGEHVRVQILVSSLPKRSAQWVSIAAAVFGFGFDPDHHVLNSIWYCDTDRSRCHSALRLYCFRGDGRNDSCPGGEFIGSAARNS